MLRYISCIFSGKERMGDMIKMIACEPDTLIYVFYYLDGKKEYDVFKLNEPGSNAEVDTGSHYSAPLAIEVGGDN